MTLEQLIEQLAAAQNTINALLDAEEDEGDDEMLDGLEIEVSDAEQAILDFVIEHADTLIAWERQHALRTSPFDEDGAR